MERGKCSGEMILWIRDLFSSALRSQLTFLASFACLVARRGAVSPFHSADNNGSGIACVFVLPGILAYIPTPKVYGTLNSRDTVPILLYEVVKSNLVRKHYVQMLCVNKWD
jgi:hypothetical protein